MSYTTSIIAARTTVEGLRDAVLQAWRKLRIAEQAANLRDLEEFHEWSERCQNAKALYQDGAWAVLFDPMMTMCADDAELASLSRALGKIFIGTTQGTAGFAGPIRAVQFTKAG